MEIWQRMEIERQNEIMDYRMAIYPNSINSMELFLRVLEVKGDN